MRGGDFPSMPRAISGSRPKTKIQATTKNRNSHVCGNNVAYYVDSTVPWRAVACPALQSTAQHSAMFLSAENRLELSCRNATFSFRGLLVSCSDYFCSGGGFFDNRVLGLKQETPPAFPCLGH